MIAQRKSLLQSFGITVISESGIYTPDDLDFVEKAGARAVLVGESLVRQPDVEDAARKLLSKQ